MKILVLMPLDEKWVYAATGIYKALPKEVKDKTFAMPMFMQYVITTKISPNWLYATFDSIAAAESVYKAADDLIIIGNMPAGYKFDAVFNFQDIEEALPYQDDFLDKIRELVQSEPILTAKLEMHQGSESLLSLKNCEATANFLSDYIETDPHFEELIQKYEDTFDILKEARLV